MCHAKGQWTRFRLSDHRSVLHAERCRIDSLEKLLSVSLFVCRTDALPRESRCVGTCIAFTLVLCPYSKESFVFRPSQVYDAVAWGKDPPET